MTAPPTFITRYPAADVWVVCDRRNGAELGRYLTLHEAEAAAIAVACEREAS